MDWQPARGEYNNTSIDWPRLRGFALRVARGRSRRDPLATSWLIERRYWKRVDRTPSSVETMRNEIHYLLARDGSLVSEVTSWSEMLNPRYWETPKEVSTREFTDADVILFDFERQYFLARDHSVETERDPTEKLIVHAKSVGLSKELEQMLPAPTDVACEGMWVAFR